MQATEVCHQSTTQKIPAVWPLHRSTAVPCHVYSISWPLLCAFSHTNLVQSPQDLASPALPISFKIHPHTCTFFGDPVRACAHAKFCGQAYAAVGWVVIVDVRRHPCIGMSSNTCCKKLYPAKRVRLLGCS